MKQITSIILLLFFGLTQAQITIPVGETDFSDWTGVKTSDEGGVFKSGDVISYRYPEGESVYKGFRTYLGHAADWSAYAGLSFSIYLDKASDVEIQLSLKVDERDAGSLEPLSKATLHVNGQGWQSVYVPWDVFDLCTGQRWGTLQGIKELAIVATSENNKKLKIKQVQVTKGHVLSVEAPIKGKSVDAGGQVQYDIVIGNTTDKVQNIQLVNTKRGWESMAVAITPSNLSLKAGETANVSVVVNVPKNIAQGVREKQVIKAIANGQGASAEVVELTTAIAVPHPNIIHTAAKWQEVKDKIDNYDWAKKGLAEYEKTASEWEVSGYSTGDPIKNAYLGRFLFRFKEASKLFDCAIAYELTGKEEYVKKCVKFIRLVTDEENGYPSTFRVNDVNFVKEGGVFQDIARATDLIYNSGYLTDEDKLAIEKTFRLFIGTVRRGNSQGGIGNWDLSEYCGAFYCALVIQDWDLVEALLNAPTGIYQQLVQGVMADGWWYECSVGYNVWCSTMFSEVAIALQPWGINMVDQEFAIGTTPFYSLLPSRMKPGLYGMDFNKWGQSEKSSICIKDMWNALINFLDYRGVMFAVNDAREDLVTGEPYELAYYLFRDPEYAAVVNRGEGRNLLYGVPDLPQVESEKTKQSSYADNIGVVQLRTQTEERPQREQIQAALHYGTHGGYHGHFDRTNFLSMMRYGRSFYNPEMIWYSYPNYVYKFLVQTSMTKNMVVVDQKMQEPQESQRTLFYEGDMMQATAVQTNARWSNPPYGGMKYDYNLDMTFPQKAWKEGRSLPIPEDAPEYGEVTDYTEDVYQRRLMLMMDDYIVLADYLEAEEEHTYDWLFQLKGFKGLQAPEKKHIEHTDQLSNDPLGAAQFFTDCDWYSAKGTARSQFEMCFGEGCDNKGTMMLHSEDGPLKVDVFNAWPNEKEMVYAMPPEAHNVSKQLWYTVQADGKELLNDSTGAWVIGSKDIELKLSNCKELVLTSKVNANNNNTIFWGDARVVLKGGKEIYLSSLPIKYNNLVVPQTAGMDFYNGPIKIGGALMSQSITGMPEQANKLGQVTVDLSGLDVEKFVTRIGGDYPLGDETSRRKTMGVRTEGKKTTYISVIEPYEGASFVKEVRAKSASVLEVELMDGRVQEITIQGLEGVDTPIQVEVKEHKNGKLLREEKTL